MTISHTNRSIARRQPIKLGCRRGHLIASAIATALTVIAAPAHAADTAKVEAAIQLLYDKGNIATANSDADAALAYTSVKFIGVDDKGARTDFRGRLDYTRNLVDKSKFVQEGTVVRACNVCGNKATVRVDDETRMETDGVTTVTDTSTSNDTWLCTSAGWKLLYRRVIAHNVTVFRREAPDLVGPGGVRLGADQQIEVQRTPAVSAVAKL